MRRYTFWVTSAYLFFTIFIVGCDTFHKSSDVASSHKTTARHPHFIKGITLGSNQNSINTPVIDENNRYVYQDIRPQPKHDTDAKAANVSPNKAVVVNAPASTDTDKKKLSRRERRKEEKEERKEEQKLEEKDDIAASAIPDKTIDKKTPVLEEKDIKKPERKLLSEKYAGIMGVNPGDISNYVLYKFIDDWYGVDYRLGGIDMDGIDCSAFAQKLYTEVFGICLLRTAMDQYNNCDWVRKTKKLKEGDLVFFHIHSRHITHVGIYLMNGYFVHASSSQGVVISNLDDDYWKKYYAGGGKIPRGYDVSVK